MTDGPFNLRTGAKAARQRTPARRECGRGFARRLDLVTRECLRAVRSRMQWRVWLASQAVMMPGTRNDAEYEQQRASEQRIHADQPDER